MLGKKTRVFSCQCNTKGARETAESIASIMPEGWTAVLLPTGSDHPISVVHKEMELGNVLEDLPFETVLVSVLQTALHDREYAESLVQQVMADSEDGEDEYLQ